MSPPPPPVYESDGAASGGRPWSIIEYGAIRGAADNTAAVQAAIDAQAGPVWIPPGVWNVTKLLYRRGTHIIGAGIGVSLLAQRAGVQDVMIECATPTARNPNFHMRDLTLTGFWNPVNQGGLSLVASDYARIERCAFDYTCNFGLKCAGGPVPGDCMYLVVRDCQVNNMRSGYGFWLRCGAFSKPDSALLEGNVVNASTGIGFFLDGSLPNGDRSDGIRITNNSTINVPVPFDILAKDVRLRDNRFETHSNMAVYVRDSVGQVTILADGNSYAFAGTLLRSDPGSRMLRLHETETGQAGFNAAASGI